MCFKVTRRHWDVLIVFDALRYDYFRLVYKFFFDGELKKVISCGSATPEWFFVNFCDKYYDDIVYISSNPYINSGTCIKSHMRGCKIIRYCAKEHISKIIDVWANSPVTPFKTTLEALKVIMDPKNKDKRIVIHFIQPHVPYISRKCECNIYRLQKCDTLASKKLLPLSKFISNVHHVFFTELFDLSPSFKIYRRIFKFVGVNDNIIFDPRIFQMDYCINKFGVRILRKCYLYNLIEALMDSLPLLSDLVEMGYKVIITSDHGELLGEYNSLEHWNGSSRRILREVPWFVVKKVYKSCIKRSSSYAKYNILKRILVMKYEELKQDCTV